jgi:cytochrome c-type biogenesis protein CcmH/NrfF
MAHKNLLIFFRVVLLCVLILSCSSAQAEQKSDAKEIFVDRELQDIAAEVISPFCPGRLLRDCPSTSARELMTEIEARLTHGESKQQIKDDLITKYGDTIRAQPQFSGTGVLAWLAPFIFLALTLVGLALFLAKSKNADSGSA